MLLTPPAVTAIALLRMRQFLLGSACAGFLMGTAGPAFGASINLNSFVYEAGAPVTIAADGSSATLLESPSLAVVYLSNLPGLGDPEVIIAGAGTLLRFTYAFTAPDGNDDLFHAAILDGASGDVISPDFEFSIGSTASGIVEFDLSTLAGSTLGLQFELASSIGDAALSSTLTVSDLQLVGGAEVPLPPALPMILPAALAMVRRFGRHRARSETRTVL